MNLQEMFKEAWSQALVGLNTAEQEAEKIFTRLADTAGFSADDVKKHARDFGQKLKDQRQELEKGLDEAVKKAMGRFRLPSREDVDALRARVDAVAARVEKLVSEKGKSL
jgi:polyhydroxyalkanoate synthesis regulator phasin